MARAQHKRRHSSWRQDIELEFVRLERVIRRVLVEAPAGVSVRKKARYEMKALERMREDEANVAARDEVQLLALSRNVQESAEAARAAAAEYDAVTAQLDAVRAQMDAGGRLPPQGIAVGMVEAAGSREPDTDRYRVCTMGISGGGGGGDGGASTRGGADVSGDTTADTAAKDKQAADLWAVRRGGNR